MKRITALILILAMLMSGIIVSSAAETEAVRGETGTVAVLSTLGATLPHNYGMDANITKEDFVYLIMKAANASMGAQAEYLEFPDVKLDAWSHDAIVTARAMGYISAKSDNSFGIEDSVSADFAINTAMRILGFDKINQMKYPVAYTNLAAACHMADSLSYEDAFELIYTMLLCPFVEGAAYSTDGAEYRVVTERSFMEEVFDVKKMTGRLTGNRFAKIGGGKTDDGEVEIDGSLYKSLCGDMQGYVGYRADFFIRDTKNGEEVITFDTRELNDEFLIENGELFSAVRSGNSIQLEFEQNGKEKKITFPLTCDFVYNGIVTDFELAKVKELIDSKSGFLKIVESGKECTVLVTAYETVIVDGVSAHKKTITGKYGEIIELPDWDEEGTFVRVLKNDKEVTFSDIKLGDVVMVARYGDYAEIIIAEHSLAGIVTKMTDETVSIDKIDYDFSKYYLNTVKSDEHQIETAMEATFFFDIYGKLIDFDDENVIYPGEFVFLVNAGRKTEAFSEECKILVVTMNAEMQTLDLAEKVFTDIGVSSSKSETVIDAIADKRELIYIEKNKNGEVFRLLADGSRLVSKDALEKNRKFKRSTGAFLVDTNDANFPEFFTSNTTVALQVPASTAADDDFFELKNYKKITLSSVLQEAENAVVEAYNFDDFNMPEVVLLRKAIAADIDGKEGLCLVSGFGKKLDDEGTVLDTVYIWSDGVETEIVVENENVLDCSVTAEENTIIRKMTEGDIVRFFYDNAGVAFASQWIDNIDSGFAVSAAPSGQNNGNAFVVGTVEEQNDTFLKIRLSGGDTMVCYKASAVNPTIYNAESEVVYGGTYPDLVKGDLVMLMVRYTAIQDIIVKITQ